MWKFDCRVFPVYIPLLNAISRKHKCPIEDAVKLRRSYQRTQGSGLGFLGSLLVETERDRERGEERESSAGKTVAANGQLIDKCAWMWMWM